MIQRLSQRRGSLGLKQIVRDWIQLFVSIGVSDLEQLRHLLTQHYINQGYINSGALLPKQVFKDGIINFQIIKGELSEIRV